MTETRTFVAEIATIPAIQAFIEGYTDAMGLHPKRSLRLQLAIEEAVVNICNYAYETPPGELIVFLALAEERLTIELRDEGIPFDPLAIEAPDLDASLEDRKLGGLGIFLIGKAVDEVRYRRDGSFNVLTMTIHNPQ